MKWTSDTVLDAHEELEEMMESVSGGPGWPWIGIVGGRAPYRWSAQTYTGEPISWLWIEDGEWLWIEYGEQDD